MSAPENLKALIGSWTGTSRLWRTWLDPQDQEQASESSASVAFAAQGKFINITYTWSVDAEPQEGALLLTADQETGAIQAVWIDSWHMSDQFMICQGRNDGTSGIAIKGSYAAPPGPDWGWRTVIDPGDGSSWMVVMYNISPDGKEELAFELRYARS